MHSAGDPSSCAHIAATDQQFRAPKQNNYVPHLNRVAAGCVEGEDCEKMEQDLTGESWDCVAVASCAPLLLEKGPCAKRDPQKGKGHTQARR